MMPLPGTPCATRELLLLLCTSVTLPIPCLPPKGILRVADTSLMISEGCRRDSHPRNSYADSVCSERWQAPARKVLPLLLLGPRLVSREVLLRWHSCLSVIFPAPAGDWAVRSILRLDGWHCDKPIWTFAPGTQARLFLIAPGRGNLKHRPESDSKRSHLRRLKKEKSYFSVRPNFTQA